MNKFDLFNPTFVPGIILLGLETVWIIALLALRWAPITYGNGAEQQLIFPATSFDRFMLATLILFALLTAAGAVSMIRLDSHSRAVVAAIAACTPLLGPFFVLGIPFGIWALIVLSREETKDLFET